MKTNSPRQDSYVPKYKSDGKNQSQRSRNLHCYGCGSTTHIFNSEDIWNITIKYKTCTLRYWTCTTRYRAYIYLRYPIDKVWYRTWSIKYMTFHECQIEFATGQAWSKVSTMWASLYSKWLISSMIQNSSLNDVASFHVLIQYLIKNFGEKLRKLKY